MAGLDISERRLPQDGGIHVIMEGRPIDLRVSTMPDKHGEKVVMRIIDNRNVLVNLENLGFEARHPGKTSATGHPLARTAWSSSPAPPAAARAPRSTRPWPN